jgi:hypothetical protein
MYFYSQGSTKNKTHTYTEPNLCEHNVQVSVCVWFFCIFIFKSILIFYWIGTVVFLIMLIL